MHFQELCGVSQVRSENDIIWCNKNIQFANKPLQFVHWAKSGIIRISDLYSDNHLTVDFLRETLNMADRPTYRANFIFEWLKIKAIFPQHSPIFEDTEF